MTIKAPVGGLVLAEGLEVKDSSLAEGSKVKIERLQKDIVQRSMLQVLKENSSLTKSQLGQKWYQ